MTDTLLKVKHWQDLCEFRLVSIDNFDMLLSINFFVKAQVAIMPYISGIMVSNATNSNFVCYTLIGKNLMMQGNDGNQFILVLQLKPGVKKNEQTYIAAFMEMKPDQFVEMLDQISKVLKDFANIMPSQLPKTLPLRHAYDHKVNLEPSTKPSTQALYRMASSELTKL